MLGYLHRRRLHRPTFPTKHEFSTNNRILKETIMVNDTPGIAAEVHESFKVQQVRRAPRSIASSLDGDGAEQQRAYVDGLVDLIHNLPRDLTLCHSKMLTTSLACYTTHETQPVSATTAPLLPSRKAPKQTFWTTVWREAIGSLIYAVINVSGGLFFEYLVGCTASEVGEKVKKRKELETVHQVDRPL
jgi:hypothetical protein